MDEYIDPLPEWQQQICRRVRELVHEADPESRRRSSAGPALLRARGQHLRAARGQDARERLPVRRGHRPDPEGIITAGHGKNRADDLHARGEPINEPPRELFRQSSPTTAPAAGARSSRPRRGLTVYERVARPLLFPRRRAPTTRAAFLRARGGFGCHPARRRHAFRFRDERLLWSAGGCASPTRWASPRA